MAAITRAVGQSGRRYLVEQILQDKPGPLGRVYLASSGNQKYVLKSVRQNKLEYYQDMFRDLQSSPYVRVADDAIPDQSMFAYKYFKDDLLSLARRDVPLASMKRLLRDSLRGIAALHERGIFHTDIKANNIMVNWDEQDGKIEIQEVQIADIEDAAYVPKDCGIVGREFGNWMWRSPEAHTAAPVGQPSDIFSFGVVCIYALTKSVIFAVDEEALPEGVDKTSVVLKRQISYFSDLQSLEGLLQHIGEASPWVKVILSILESFGKDSPRQPIALWGMLDPVCKDVIGKMTTVNPAMRITAKDALAHPWFADVPENVGLSNLDSPPRQQQQQQRRDLPYLTLSS